MVMRADARIPVRKETLERLKSVMKKGDTYDKFINHLLDRLENGIYLDCDEVPELEKVKEYLKTDDKRAVLFLLNFAVEVLSSEVDITFGKKMYNALKKVIG